MGRSTKHSSLVDGPAPDRHFKKYDGPSAKIPGETSTKRFAKTNAFKKKFIEFARSALGEGRTLLAVTFTYPPSASEDSLYGQMLLLAKRVAKRPLDSLWVVATEAAPKKPKSLRPFHWHGIAAIGSGKRDQEWFKDEWASRVGANRKAIDAPMVRYSGKRDSSNFVASASRWINYCCRAPNPSLPLPIKFRVVASGELAKIWESATKYAPVVDSNFEPHSWVSEHGDAQGEAGESKHPPCSFCGGAIPNARRLGAMFCKDAHKDAFHNAKKKKKKKKASYVPRRPH